MKDVETFAKEEDESILRYLAELSKSECSQIGQRRLWTGFLKQSKSARSLNSVISRFRTTLGPQIHACRQLDLLTRARMLFVSRSAIDKLFLKELEKIADVDTDKDGLITKFSVNRPGEGLRLFAGNAPFTGEECKNMMTFLAWKASTTNERFQMHLLWQEYKEWADSPRSVASLREKFRSHISTSVHKNDDAWRIPGRIKTNDDGVLASEIHQHTMYSVKMRARILFATKTPVPSSFLKEMRKDATASIDKKRRITDYENNKSGLRLSTTDENEKPTRTRATKRTIEDSDEEKSPAKKKKGGSGGRKEKKRLQAQVVSLTDEFESVKEQLAEEKKNAEHWKQKFEMLQSAVKDSSGDIGGLDMQKHEVREVVELPLTHGELYQQIGIDPPRGVLMYGPLT
ncbi:unnamed protein product [Caenorhabditis sp. 36 PRJEB53466]|nr:unnamed protein product [Caenorhabditis sp. 36 PRJEB53466]